MTVKTNGFRRSLVNLSSSDFTAFYPNDKPGNIWERKATNRKGDIPISVWKGPQLCICRCPLDFVPNIILVELRTPWLRQYDIHDRFLVTKSSYDRPSVRSSFHVTQYAKCRTFGARFFDGKLQVLEPASFGGKLHGQRSALNTAF